MAEPKTTGTPGQEGGDGAAQAAQTGTPAPDDRNAGDDAAAERERRLEALEREKHQWLAEKSNYEEAKRRLDSLEQPGQVHTPPTGPDLGAYQQQEALRIWQELQETNPAAAQAVAATAQMAQKEIQSVRNELRWYRELESVPREDRPSVEERARKLGVSPEWAYARMKAEALDTAMTQIVDQKRKLQEEQERIKRGAVRTDAEPAPPAPPDSNEITASEYGKLARAAASGDAAARKRIRDYDEGRLKIREG